MIGKALEYGVEVAGGAAEACTRRAGQPTQHQGLNTMASPELDALTAEVTHITTVAASAVTLIQGLSQMVKDAGTDPVKLKALTDQLDASDTALSDAITANTPAA